MTRTALVTPNGDTALESAVEPPRDLDRPLRLLHVGIHDKKNANAGDTLLFKAVRDLIEHAAGHVEWSLQQLWEPFDLDKVRTVNASLDGVVVGGGGLLLRDQEGSDTSRSGWQWNATIDAVRALKVPLVVFAIGYNRFRGQDDFEPPFAEHLAAVVKMSTFFGLRSSGSLRAVAGYLPPPLRERLRLLHCPTTALTQLYGHQAVSKERQLGVNFAFDRQDYRFEHDLGRIMEGVSDAIMQAHRDGWRVRVLRHKTMDAQGEEFLDRTGIDYETHDLSAAAPGDIVNSYRGLAVVLGMRGHGQLIPFGLQIPIVSLVTHDKLAWFLEDLGRPSWGVDAASGHLAERISEAIDEASTERRLKDVADRQNEIWGRTRQTVAGIVRALRTRTTLGLEQGK